MAYSRFEPFSSVDIPDDQWADNVAAWRAARDRFDPVAAAQPQVDSGKLSGDRTAALRVAEMPHAAWQMARAEQLAARNAGTTSAAPKPAPAIDPSRTPVFQTGPDGKLHPIPGWRTTGPFDVGTWAHNIHWAGVGHDISKIVREAIKWSPPFLLETGPAAIGAAALDAFGTGQDTLDDINEKSRDGGR